MSWRYAGDRFYQEQPNYKTRIILAVLLALAIAAALGVISAFAADLECSYGVGAACPCQSDFYWNAQDQACESNK